VSPRAGLDAVAKKKIPRAGQESNPDHSARILAAIPDRTGSLKVILTVTSTNGEGLCADYANHVYKGRVGTGPRVLDFGSRWT
jgi:hypothetical protein